ncbi:MAG: chloride channel protein [Coriobacteriales bacterium]|nr:chloride channel protein [Coriobacteriales bacterium]
MSTKADPKTVRARRPYVGDQMRVPQEPLGSASVTISFVLLALAVGFVIGFAVYLLMNLSSWLTQLLWGLSGSYAFFPLAACTLGGIAIGLWTWWSHDEIKPLKEVMGEFKRTGSYRVNGVWKPVVTFLLPLVFGGSIGFEAGLTGLITAGCCWIRDQIKRAGLRLADITDVTIAAAMAAIFRTPLAGIAVSTDEEPDVNGYDMRRGPKIVLYIAAAFGAFAGIRVFSAIFSVSGGLPRFEEVSSSAQDLLWVIPCLALAYGMTLVFHASSRLFGMIGSRMKEHAAGIIARPIICGVVIGAIACFLPYVLFPGETQAEELMETWTTWTAVALLATGVLKAAVTPFCIHMGWVGGDLFPSIFAGVAAGYGMAALTGADPMLMVTVTTAAFLAGVLRKPLIALGILFLCFPADGILWMGIACVIGATLPVPAALLGKKE